jgi:hypothetical protein
VGHPATPVHLARGDHPEKTLRSTGEPPIGGAWYAPWASKSLPDYSGHDDVLEMIRPSIIGSVRRSGIIDRIAEANR